MEWVIIGVLASLMTAAISEANRYFQQDGFRLNFWRSGFVFIALLPVLPFLTWPPLDSLLYPVSILVGGVSVVGMTIRLNLAAQHNGRVASLFGPVQTFTLFLMWLMVDENARQVLVQNPFDSLGVLVTFILATFALVGLRRNDVSWKAFLVVAPIGVLYAASDVFMKIVLNEGEKDSLDVVLILLCISFGVATLLSMALITARSDPKRPVMTKKMVKAGLVMGVLTLVKTVLSLYGLMIVPNPAYFIAIMVLVPVWLMIYHRIIGLKDDASPFMSCLLVLSAILLVYFTQGHQ